MPPLSLFLATVFGLVLRRWKKALGTTIAVGASLVLVALCMPWVSAWLLTSLQTEPALPRVPRDGKAGAIVVLGADVQPYAPELGGPTVGPLTLERLRYAAEIARETGLPVLASGGVTQPRVASLAELMERSLEDDFRVETRWTETASRNTRENAKASAAILEERGIDRIYLVTHAWHMPRAKGAFERTGLQVVPAPTAFRAPPSLEPMSFVPSARSLRESQWAIHEWLGRVWYALSS